MEIALTIIIVSLTCLILYRPVRYIIRVYNILIVLRNDVEHASSDIDLHLKQRNDLITNLVEVVKGYAKHESKTLEAVIAARNDIDRASTLEEKDKNNSKLEKSLRSIYALSEAYPDLKANKQFLSLQNQITEIEYALLGERKTYNQAVNSMNDKVLMFPTSLVAWMFKFKKLNYLKISNEDLAKPSLNF